MSDCLTSRDRVYVAHDGRGGEHPVVCTALHRWWLVMVLLLVAVVVMAVVVVMVLLAVVVVTVVVAVAVVAVGSGDGVVGGRGGGW